MLLTRAAAEAVSVRQPLVVVSEGRRQCVHELERDAELACADVLDAGGAELLLEAADVELAWGDRKPIPNIQFGGEQ